MKLILEQPTYSLYNHQERIECFPDNSNTSVTIETIQSVLENRFFSKRIETYSLPSRSIMTRTDVSEEQTDSFNYENTYFYSEETSQLDDSLSLTTITPNLPKECNLIEKDTSISSDNEDDSSYSNSDEDISSSSQLNLIGLMSIKRSSNDLQILFNNDLVNQSSEQHNTIRSSVDIVSLNSSMTSSISPIGKQLNQQEKKRTNDEEGEEDDDDEYYIIVNQSKSREQLTMNNHTNEIEDEDYLESTKLYDNGQYDGIHSDESQGSDDLRYSSNALQISCLNDDVSNTSSTLRQEAMSITKVRCKQRQTWFNSSQHLLQSYQSNKQVDGSNAIALNTNINSILRTTNSFDCKIDENMDVKSPSYDFLQLNSDHQTMKTNEAIVSPLLKTNNTLDKDASSSSTSTKTKNFYLIHHQSSLVPIKHFLNQTLNSNIELIQMDEQESTLEIVDGVVTLVPKTKSIDMESDDEPSFDEPEKNSIEDQTNDQGDSPKREKRSSSTASSISTPSISEHEPEREEISSSSSRLSSNKEQVQEPFVLLRDIPSKSPPLPSQTDQSVDLLDLFSTPLVPSSQSNPNEKNSKNLLDDSLSSVSSYEQSSESSDKEKVPSPVNHHVKALSPSASIKDDLSAEKNSSTNDEPEVVYPLPKSEPPPAAKPINKARINEFASLLSAAVHLNPTPINKKSETTKTISAPSPARSEEQSYSSIRSTPSDRDERESYHTVKSNINSDLEQTKKHIDARYNEKIDDRQTIQINTSNIKALFEQKISDTKSLAQSNEQLTEARQQQHKKAPISYASVKHNPPQSPQTTNRRQSFQDSPAMNKYSEHIVGTKDIVIEEKKPEHTHQTQAYGGIRRNNTEQIIRPGVDSLTNSPVTIPNGYYSESLIAREIRETKEKEEELRQQRKKCGLPEDASSLLTTANNHTAKSDSSPKPAVKSDSFLANLGFFTSKANESNTPRRSTISIQNLVYDSHGTSPHEDRKPSFTQESTRSNENTVPIIRTGSSNSYMHRSSSNQNLLSAQNNNNIIQREIEAIRAKEAELRQMGRIQHTSDEHSDPRKYQELVPPIPKSHSINILSTGKPRRDTERINKPLTATSNGILKPKPMNNSSSMSSIRGKFPSPNPTAPIISSASKTADYSKLSSTDRLELEKRECQEREQELKKQRHSVTGATLSVNSTINGDSGNASQDEHDEDQEHYFEKMQRLKRTENEKAQAPLVRPTKKLNLSQKWEQMMANKASSSTGDADADDEKY